VSGEGHLLGDGIEPVPAPSEDGTRGPVSSRNNRGLRVGLLVVAILVLGVTGVSGYVLLWGGPRTSYENGELVAETVVGTGTDSLTATTAPSEALRTPERDPFAGGRARPSGSVPVTGAPSTATVTVTAEAPVYVGLYGFADGKADFWVNATEYAVSVGEPFASDFTYEARTDQGCARVTHAGAAETICAGQVKTFD
jgi:hypothetical protein